MNTAVTIGAANVVQHVDAGIMFGCFLLVAANTFNLLDFDLAGHVLVQIGDFHMTAVAGILAMDGRCHRFDGHGVVVALQTGCRIKRQMGVCESGGGQEKQ
jgi:hypothetical protein